MAANVHTLQLKHPVTVGAEQITELNIRRINGADMRKMPAAPTPGDNLNLLGRLCGLPPTTVDMLDAEDIDAAGKVIEGFLPSSQPTGL